jgi:hypothetical protein
LSSGWLAEVLLDDLSTLTSAESSNISMQCDGGSAGQSEQISIAAAQVKAATLLISRAAMMTMKR